MAKKKEVVAKQEAPKGRPVPKEVQIKLTAQQCLQRTDSAGSLNKEKTDLQKEFEAEEKEWKKRRAEYKSKIKNLQEQVDKLLSEVKAKAATETVTVTLVLNHDAGVAEYWYESATNGWEVVDTRPLEDNERQLSIVEDQVAAMPDDGQSVEA